MGIDENEAVESASGEENSLGADRRNTRHRGSTLGILIAALLVAEVSKDVAFSANHGHLSFVHKFFYYLAIAALPFLLAKVAPQAAAFDTRWLPTARRQWIWFAGMIVLLFIAWAVVAALAVATLGAPSIRPYIGPVTATQIVFAGIAAVLFAPVAEEVFFRGYLLDQLTKLMRPGAAVVVQAILFGLIHLYTRGLFTSFAVVSLTSTFLIGLILGAWRLKFKGLLPLMLAHALFNAAATSGLIIHFIDRSHPKYTISEQTTRITEPLKKGGFVDYVAALNQQFSRGVTPENNAAVPFWKAVGPDKILPEYREEYFGMLGIPPVPENGDYFVGFDDYVKERKNGTTPGGSEPRTAPKDYKQEPLYLAARRPWSPSEFPRLAQWLAANDKPLATLIEASKRPRRYDPLVCEENTFLIAVLYPALQKYGDVVEALCVRAMLRLQEGKPEEAWEDLLACHRFARLIGQGPTLVDTVFAFSRDRTACAAEEALLAHGPLTASRIAKMRADLKRLPPLPKVADRIEFAERFVYLDAMAGYSREGAASLTGLAAPEMIDLDPDMKRLKGTIDLLLQHSEDTEIDWDLVLRMGNLWYDRLVDACRKPIRAARKEALDKLDEDFRRLKKTAEDAASLDEALRRNPRQAISVRFGEVALSVLFVPWDGPLKAQDCWTMRAELNDLAFALAAYRADHGAYPDKLGDLVPDYVEKLPTDLFGGSKLHYRRESTGYLLYSVGPNGKDDGGKGMEDREDDEDWDDVSVRIAGPGEAPQARH